MTGYPPNYLLLFFDVVCVVQRGKKNNNNKERMKNVKKMDGERRRINYLNK